MKEWGMALTSTLHYNTLLGPGEQRSFSLPDHVALGQTDPDRGNTSIQRNSYGIQQREHRAQNKYQASYRTSQCA